MTALVAGSMVPDIPLFLRRADGYELTHSLLGVLLVDVVLAVGVAVVWSYGVRDAVVAALPPAVLPATVVASGLVGVAAAAVHAPQGFHVTAFWGVVGALIAFVLLMGGACVAWHLARRRRAVRTG